MAQAHQLEQLLNSFKSLYSNPEFSDLNIVSTHKTYPVHKAVVCTRSPYFAKKCRDPGFGVESNTVEVKDDDPQAVHLAIEYLYNLNYSDTLPDELLQPNGHTNGHVNGQNGSSPQDFAVESPVIINGFGHSNGVETSSAPEDQPAEGSGPQQADSYDASASLAGDSALDDSLPSRKPIPPKKKKKSKKGRKPSDVAEATPAEDAVEEPQPTPLGEEKPPLELAPESPTTPTPTPQPVFQSIPQTKLTTHAKLHSLSAKYGITELQSLSLSKFQDQAQTGWDADDFVRAAGEVYASPLLAEENHREMRGAVTGLLFGHKELMDKTDMRDILRGDLGLDLITRFRDEGVW